MEVKTPLVFNCVPFGEVLPANDSDFKKKWRTVVRTKLNFTPATTGSYAKKTIKKPRKLDVSGVVNQNEVDKGTKTNVIPENRTEKVKGISTRSIEGDPLINSKGENPPFSRFFRRMKLNGFSIGSSRFLLKRAFLQGARKRS